jgi:CO/xanthine dehydrogenase Mo-binding subunit
MAAKVTGHHTYLHDLRLPGMLHARVVRPPALGAALASVDEASIAAIPGARVVRVQNFLAVVAETEWNAVRASRALRATWGPGVGLPDHATQYDVMRMSPVVRRIDVLYLFPGGIGIKRNFGAFAKQVQAPLDDLIPGWAI